MQGISIRQAYIGRYNAPFVFDGPYRCDLHPRWSRDGKQVCFDSVPEGKRRIYVVDVSAVVQFPAISETTNRKQA